jgi:hypothetical protein
MVTNEQWQAAQVAERKQHTLSRAEGYEHYMDSYRQYLDFVGFDLQKGTGTSIIVEIGPADFAALMYMDVLQGVIIEPMPSAILREWIDGHPWIDLVTQPAENYKIEPIGNRIEVWLFNVLQHVIDPDAIIANCKYFASTVRFFEPINCGTDECHLHNLTIEMFKNWFGVENVNYYPPNPDAKNFHTHESAYGVWSNPNV